MDDGDCISTITEEGIYNNDNWARMNVSSFSNCMTDLKIVKRMEA